jgi:O-methyltransferase involved in polyketide biosynthesis
MTSADLCTGMETRESVVGLQGVAESLLLTLSSRAFESVQKSPILRDAKALQVLERLNFDVAPLTRNRLYHTIICLRARRFDAAVAAFLHANPDGTIVNLGCGLDTRFERMDNGRAHWVEIDLPEVIELRRKLLQENSRRQFLGCSITAQSWWDALDGRAARPVLFLAEGVLMFLGAREVRELVVGISGRFPGGSVLFDAVKPIEVTLGRYHPTLRNTRAALRWGLSGSQEVEAWHPALRLASEWFYCDEVEPRLGWYRLLRYVPWLGRTAWILHFDF